MSTYLVSSAVLSDVVRDKDLCQEELLIPQFDDVVRSLMRLDVFDFIALNEHTGQSFGNELSVQNSEDLKLAYSRKILVALAMNYLFLSSRRDYWAADASFAYCKAADIASLLAFRNSESFGWNIRSIVARTRSAGFILQLGFYPTAFSHFVDIAATCDTLVDKVAGETFFDWNRETLEDECRYLLGEARILERYPRTGIRTTDNYFRLLNKYHLLDNLN